MRRLCSLSLSVRSRLQPRKTLQPNQTATATRRELSFSYMLKLGEGSAWNHAPDCEVTAALSLPLLVESSASSNSRSLSFERFIVVSGSWQAAEVARQHPLHSGLIPTVLPSTLCGTSGQTRAVIKRVPSSCTPPNHEIKIRIAIRFSVLIGSRSRFLDPGPVLKFDFNAGSVSDFGRAFDSNFDPTLDTNLGHILDFDPGHDFQLCFSSCAISILPSVTMILTKTSQMLVVSK
ncbi:hypothetical protein EVAR_17841_1 [Eumeta japonica]|uniref:Uncharacterized protein n=1 Tax=Eumeta variegata TaxID=151549 RepID=A0A4C1TTP6_EUMVA|nr:hypothetical protein EVAR_17841_1 [Eumeta japonica]